MKLSDAFALLPESTKNLEIECLIIAVCRSSDMGTSVFRWNIDKEATRQAFAGLARQSLDDGVVTVTGREN